MLSPIPDVGAWIATREAWHALAERVLAPARHAVTGRIGLRVAPGGITTPPFGADDRRITVQVGRLTERTAAATRSTGLTDLGRAAAFVGVAPDADTGVYTPTTPSAASTDVRGDDPLATVLVAWFEFGLSVLDPWRGGHSGETPSEIQLWPEHFDLATDLGPDDARRANYGASPGDADHPLPYLYVGPWEPNDDPFWNAGGYARLPYGALVDAASPARVAADFFAAGHAAASGKS